MHISEFDYELPVDLIAQTPLEQRDASRMLVLDRGKRAWADSSFKNFTSYLRPNDVVVVNNSRVIPARLIGHREETGGQVEIFLVREIETGSDFVVVSAVELEPTDAQRQNNPSAGQAGPVDPNNPTGSVGATPPARRGKTHGEIVSLRLEMAAYFRRPNAIPAQMTQPAQ